jgi:hypothetical protein
LRDPELDGGRHAPGLPRAARMERARGGGNRGEQHGADVGEREAEHDRRRREPGHRDRPEHERKERAEIAQRAARLPRFGARSPDALARRILGAAARRVKAMPGSRRSPHGRPGARARRIGELCNAAASR